MRFMEGETESRENRRGWKRRGGWNGNMKEEEEKEAARKERETKMVDRRKRKLIWMKGIE